MRQVAAACALPGSALGIAAVGSTGGARPVESRAHSHLGRFEIDAPGGFINLLLNTQSTRQGCVMM